MEEVGGVSNSVQYHPSTSQMLIAISIRSCIKKVALKRDAVFARIPMCNNVPNLVNAFVSRVAEDAIRVH